MGVEWEGPSRQKLGMCRGLEVGTHETHKGHVK